MIAKEEAPEAAIKVVNMLIEPHKLAAMSAESCYCQSCRDAQAPSC
jgi:hypothetical protein